MVTGVDPSLPQFLPSIFIAHRVQQSHCSSIFYRVLLTHALALSASQFVRKKKSHRIYTSMHSAGLELTKLTYTRLEDNLIRHRGDRMRLAWVGLAWRGLGVVVCLQALTIVLARHETKTFLSAQFGSEAQVGLLIAGWVGSGWVCRRKPLFMSADDGTNGSCPTRYLAVLQRVGPP